MVSRHFFNGILLGLHTSSHQPGQEQTVEASFHLVNNILYMQIHREISVRKLLPSSHDDDERYSNNFIFYGNVQQKQSRSLLQISSLLPLNDQRNSSYYSAALIEFQRLAMDDIASHLSFRPQYFMGGF